MMQMMNSEEESNPIWWEKEMKIGLKIEKEKAPLQDLGEKLNKSK